MKLFITTVHKIGQPPIYFSLKMHTVVRADVRISTLLLFLAHCIAIRIPNPVHSVSVYTYLFKELPCNGARVCARNRMRSQRFPAKVIKQKNKSIYFWVRNFHTWWFRIRKRLQKRSPFHIDRIFLLSSFFLARCGSQDDLMTQKNGTSREKITNIIACSIARSLPLSHSLPFCH